MASKTRQNIHLRKVAQYSSHKINLRQIMFFCIQKKFSFFLSIVNRLSNSRTKSWNKWQRKRDFAINLGEMEANE